MQRKEMVEFTWSDIQNLLIQDEGIPTKPYVVHSFEEFHVVSRTYRRTVVDKLLVEHPAHLSTPTQSSTEPERDASDAGGAPRLRETCGATVTFTPDAKGG